MSTNLSNLFPLLPPKDALLSAKVNAVNNIRLGFLDPAETNGIERISKVNSALAEVLPELSDEDAFVLMENLSQAYAYVKVWLETKRKKAIKLEVDEREQKKLEAALAERSKPRRKAKEAKAETPKPTRKLEFSSDPKINKAIKTFVEMTGGNVNQAIAAMKAIGALPSDFELENGV